MTGALNARSLLASLVLLGGLAAGCGSDEDKSSTTDATAVDSSDADESTTDDDSTADESTDAESTDAEATDGTVLDELGGAESGDESTGAGGSDAAGVVGGDVEMTFTVLNSEANPSLNGVETTVTGYCSLQTEFDAFVIEGGTYSEPGSADRPDYVTFIGGAPDEAGVVNGLLTVVEEGLEAASFSNTGTFDGTKLSLNDADGQPIFELELSVPCVGR